LHPKYRSSPRFQNSAFKIAVEHGYIDIVKHLILVGVNPAQDGDYALRIASQMGHLEVVSHLLRDPRVDPRATQCMSLFVASQNGHMQIVEELFHVMNKKRTF